MDNVFLSQTLVAVSRSVNGMSDQYAHRTTVAGCCSLIWGAFDFVQVLP